MPRGNRTGPWGEGPRTGRAMGPCAGYDSPGFMQPGPGAGFGRKMGFRLGSGPGFGSSRGWRRSRHMSATGYYPDLPPQPSPEEELRWLKEEADALARHQDQLSKRIQELEKRD